MHKLENDKPKFIHGDLVKIKITGELVMIKDVKMNTCQYQDIHQWSYSILHIDKQSKSHVAWYNNKELELVNNIFEIISKGFRTSFTDAYILDFNTIRRN